MMIDEYSDLYIFIAIRKLIRGTYVSLWTDT